MTTTDKNNILTVTRRPVKAAAVQYTGKNGAEVVSFIKEYFGEPEGFKVRNGGSYVSVNDGNHISSGKLRKGDWAVVDANGALLLLPPEEFDILFNIKKG